jgi:hypothetical protein
VLQSEGWRSAATMTSPLSNSSSAAEISATTLGKKNNLALDLNLKRSTKVDFNRERSFMQVNILHLNSFNSHFRIKREVNTQHSYFFI